MYYLSADGGGTKLLVVLYDENLKVIATASAGGTNTNFRPEAEVRQDMERAINACVQPDEPLECAYLCIVGPSRLFEELLRKRTEVKRTVFVNEGEMALLAGAGVQHGVLALSGTGSGVFALQPEGRTHIGGWGSIFGDEGSGYEIGAMTLRAAIFASDGRGPATAIAPLLMKRWGLESLRGIVSRVYNVADTRRPTASAALIAREAAEAGDAVALSIYAHAARQIAHMTVTLLSKTPHWTGPIVVGGSVWKGNTGMFQTYSELVKEHFPDASVLMPLFEPVVGGAALFALESDRKPTEFLEVMKREFNQYIY